MAWITMAWRETLRIFMCYKNSSTSKDMDLRELQQLVARGEGMRLEFKRKAADPVKIMREVVAFANSEGGDLLIGVSDDGSIPGLKYPEEEAFVLDQAIQKYCRPMVQYTKQIIPLNRKKSVLRYHIKSNPVKPVFLLYNLKKQRGKAYIRLADKSIQSSREVREILKARSRDIATLLQYGQLEQFILRYLSQNEQVNVETFMKLANISYLQASDTLVKLTLSDVLELHPGDLTDYYTLKEPDPMVSA
ncbi:ATP-binding protein [Rapidithrix thailandica]|uniref:ATP-binding protein n=1 Tax=Rapidithrix thailandica TaxID=413964 RepID=A0AAW9RZB1_9BACT